MGLADGFLIVIISSAVGSSMNRISGRILLFVAFTSPTCTVALSLLLFTEALLLLSNLFCCGPLGSIFESYITSSL